MKLPIALSVALAGMAFSVAVSAYAQPTTPSAAPAAPTTRRIEVHGGGGHHGMAMRMHLGDADANHDGWLSRAEASAQADRMFAEMDSNNDGKLDEADRRAHHEAMADDDDGDGNVIIRRVGPGGEHGEHGDSNVIIRRVGPGGEPGGAEANVNVEHLPNGDIVIHRGQGGDGDRNVHVETHGDNTTVERHVFVMRDDDDGDDDHHGDGPRPPHPPMAMHMPMMGMMIFASNDEADTNGDHAMSREEFRNQQLRYFDASDANRDGKIRMPRMPEMAAPPAPPTPPAPPAPPARR